MAQRLLGISPEHRIPPEQPSCDVRGPALALALERIGFDVSNWDQLNWYVKFSQKHLQKLSGGDLRNLQEELVALLRVLENHSNPPFLTVQQIEPIQVVIKRHLEDLADKGTTILGPFKAKILVSCPKKLDQKFRELGRLKLKPGAKPPVLPSLVTHRILVSDSFSVISQGLTYHLAQLLELYGSSIERCPHCKTIFAQFRRSARFCSRHCQSVSAVQRIRARNRRQHTARKAKRRKKGGTRHGQKTR